MKRRRVKPTVEARDFDSLVASIVRIHHQAQDFAAKAVNVGLTLRNWFIGHRIVEFEQKGADRATYGERLLPTLAKRLAAAGLKRVDTRELRRFRLLYIVYPHIRESVTPESQIPGAAHPSFIHRLSFTHLSELIQLPDDSQRRFYEVECIRGNWSVRELRRQIDGLYYERSGLSENKAKLSAATHAQAETLQLSQIIRDPYVFDFLGLQDFLLEMGHGFCFEARQKRLLIGDDRTVRWHAPRPSLVLCPVGDGIPE